MSLIISSFSEWYEEADIPEFDEELKLWRDLETGLYYDPFGKLDGSKPCQPVTPRYVPSENVKNARKFIKTIGGKALTGTPKQKEWAEKIRLDKMIELDPEDAKQVVFHEIFAHSKFWIETRDKSAESILTFARRVISYTKIINELGKVLNILAEYADVKFAYDEFEKLWNESENILPVDAEEIVKKSYLKDDFTPYEMYIKMMIEYFGNRVEYDPYNIELLLPEKYMRLKYQTDAANQGYSIMQKHNGFILADVVGLGKTIIATMIIKKFIYEFV